MNLRDTQRDCGQRKPTRVLRSLHELHSRLRRSASPFSLVTSLTRGDDIVPRFFAALNDRNDVIKGEVISIESVSAILAGEPITTKHVISGKANDGFFLLNRHVLQQSQNRRDF